MLRVILPLVWLCLVFCSAQAQEGNYFLSHFTPPDERIDFRSSAMVQDQLGVLYFTNKNGVLEFDGKTWQEIKTPGASYTIAVQRNEVFVGGLFGFGKLSEAKGAQRRYLPLVEVNNIFSAQVIDDYAYLCNEDQLIVYALKTSTIEKTLRLEKGDSFMGIHLIGSKIFASTAKRGHVLVAGDQVTPPSFDFPQPQEIVFAINDSSSTLIGTDENKLYRLLAGNLAEIKLSDPDILSKSIVLSAALVHRNLLAIGTLRKGVIFLNPDTGAVVEIMDYATGLPDNEVFALMCDKNSGVWVAHEYGFTRIAPDLPFRSFNHYQGLSGNLLCVQSKNNQLYAGTTLGLFLLTEETVEVESNISEQKGKRKILNFLHKGVSVRENTSPEQKQSTSNTKKKQVVKTKRSVYRKVNGIEGKVTQLIVANDKLLAVGLDGVFEVQGITATAVFDEPVRSAFLSRTVDQLLVSTFDEHVLSFEVQGKTWRQTHLLDTLRDHISYMFEDKLENIWLCGRTKIYKVEMAEGLITNVLTLPIANPSLDETVGLAYGSEVYVAASGEFKRYNGDDQFLRYDSLPGPRKYFASAGNFWFNDGHKWRTIDRRIQNLKLEWLALFPNLRFLAPSEGGDGLWLITSNNELYKFYNKQAISEGQRYPLFLKEIKGREVDLKNEQKIEFSQSENSLSFEFIQPSYVGKNGTEYRYQVKGLTNAWSNWSRLNDIIPFPYLAPGSYQLMIQSRDILGMESKPELINFEILPPYWKQWWFYALEFLFFGLLVFLTVKLSANNQRYRVVSQVLSLLTVVLLIQFIQTGINSVLSIKSSPVVEFFIQVCITLIVFPIEIFAEKSIQKASAGKLKLKLPLANRDNENTKTEA